MWADIPLICSHEVLQVLAKDVVVDVVSMLIFNSNAVLDLLKASESFAIVKSPTQLSIGNLLIEVDPIGLTSESGHELLSEL